VQVQTLALRQSEEVHFNRVARICPAGLAAPRRWALAAGLAAGRSRLSHWVL